MLVRAAAATAHSATTATTATTPAVTHSRSTVTAATLAAHAAPVLALLLQLVELGALLGSEDVQHGDAELDSPFPRDLMKRIHPLMERLNRLNVEVLSGP